MLAQYWRLADAAAKDAPLSGDDDDDDDDDDSHGDSNGDGEDGGAHETDVQRTADRKGKGRATAPSPEERPETRRTSSWTRPRPPQAGDGDEVESPELGVYGRLSPEFENMDAAWEDKVDKDEDMRKD